MSLLANRTAVISGGLGDIGQAIVRALARAGANIAFCDLRSLSSASDLLAELTDGGTKSLYHQVDVTDVDAVSVWLTEVEDKLGLPELIVPNAATVTVTDILDVSPHDWTKELDVNLHGAFYLAQIASRRLVAAGRTGRIVVVGSWAAHAPHPNMPAYCVSKAGLRMLSRLFALRLAPHGILVNELAPGFVDAGVSGRIFEQDPELKAQAQQWVPVRRLIEAAEVADQVVHLLLPSNRHITGSTVLMDGGLSLTNVGHGSGQN